MDTSTGLAIANTAAQIANVGVNAFAGGITTKSYAQARQAQWDAMLAQRDWAVADWNKQNEYNHPSAQMERLREAGLNPNLVYGSGNATGNAGTPTGAAGGVPAFSGYQMPQNMLGGLGNIIEGFSTAMGMKKMEHEISSIDAHTALTIQQRVSEEIKQDGYRLTNAKTAAEAAMWTKKLEMDMALSHSIIEKQAAELGFITENTRGAKIRNDITDEFGAKQALATLNQTEQSTRRSVSDMLLDQYRGQLMKNQAAQALENSLSTQWDRLNLKPVQRREVVNRIASIISQNKGYIQENQIRQILIDEGIDIRDGNVLRSIVRSVEHKSRQIRHGYTGYW